jgi:hypothetical protein
MVRVLNELKPAQMVYAHRESMLVTVGVKGEAEAGGFRLRVLVIQLEFGQCH